MANETREIVTLVLRLIREDKGATKEIKQEFKNLQTAITQLQKAGTLDLEKFFKGKETPKELAKAFQDAKAHLEKTRKVIESTGTTTGGTFNNINRVIAGFGQVTEENALKALKALGKVTEQQEKVAETATESAEAVTKGTKKFIDGVPQVAAEVQRLKQGFAAATADFPNSLKPLEERLVQSKGYVDDLRLAAARLRSLLSTTGFTPEQKEVLKGLRDEIFKLQHSTRNLVGDTERHIKTVEGQERINQAATETLRKLSGEFYNVLRSSIAAGKADEKSITSSQRLIKLYEEKFDKVRLLERALNNLVSAESKVGAQVTPDVRKQFEDRLTQTKRMLDHEKASLATIRAQRDEYVKHENAIRIQEGALERVNGKYNALFKQLETASQLAAVEMAKIRPDPLSLSRYVSTARRTLTEVTAEVLNVNKSLESLKKPGESSFKGIQDKADAARRDAENLRSSLERLQKEAGGLIERTGAEAESARVVGNIAKNFKKLQQDQLAAFADLRKHLKDAENSTQKWTSTAEQGVRKYTKELVKTRDRLEDLRRQALAVNDIARSSRIESTLRRVQRVIDGANVKLADLVKTGSEFRSKETLSRSFADTRNTLTQLGQQFKRHAEAFKRSDFLEAVRSLSKEQLRVVRSDLENLQHQYNLAARGIGRDLASLAKVKGVENITDGFKKLNLRAAESSITLADFISTIRLVEKDTTKLSELGRKFGINFAGSYKQMAEGGSLIHKVVGGLFNFIAKGHEQSVERTHTHVAALKQLENELVRFRSGVAEWSLSLLALGGLVTAPFVAAIAGFLEFSDVMGVVRAVTNATSDQFNDLMQVASEMGAVTRFTAEQAAQGLRFLAMAGFNAAQSVAALPTALNLAQAAAIGLGDAADIVTNIMTGFEMQISDLPNAADVLTKAFTTSNSTLSELGFAFKYVGAIGKGLGADFNDLVGSLALLHNAGFKGCYDRETEVMTRSGFKLFKDLTYEDEIMTLNPDTLEMEWQKPTAIVSYKINEPLAYIKSRYLDLAVTNNHRLFIETRAGIRKIVIAEDFKEGHFFRTGNWVGEDEPTFVLPGLKQDRSTWIKEVPPLIIPMETWVEFLGWYFSEGSIGNKGRGNYNIALTQKEGTPGVDAIRSVLDRLPFNYNRSDASFRIGSQQLYNELMQYGEGFANKRIPQYIKDSSPKHLRIFLEAFRQGDGDSQFNLYTSNGGLKDDLYEIALKAGYGVSVAQTHEAGAQRVINGRTITATQPGHVVSISTQHTRPYFSLAYIENKNRKGLPVENSFEWHNYDDVVYCAEVPNHLMYVRRNGKGVFCGNTMAGTALRGALDSMFNPTKQEAEVMQQLSDRIGVAGFNIVDASGKFVGFTEIVRQLEEAGFTSGEALALFGQRAGPGMAALLRMGSRQLEDYVDNLDAAGGTTDRISKQMEETLKGRFLLAFSALSALGDQIAHNLEPVLGAIADSISTVVNKIIQFRTALGPITKVLDIIVASGAALIATLGALTFAWFLLLVPAAQFITFLHTITAVVASGTVALADNTKAAGINATAQNTLTGAYLRQVFGLRAATASTAELAAAQAAAAAEAIKAGSFRILDIVQPPPGHLLRTKKVAEETAEQFNKAMRDKLADAAPDLIGLSDRLKGIFLGTAVTIKEVAKRLVDDLRGTISGSVAAATGAAAGVTDAASAAADAASIAAGSKVKDLFLKFASVVRSATTAVWGLVTATLALGATGVAAITKFVSLLATAQFAQAGLMLAHGFKVAWGVISGLFLFLKAHPIIAIITGLVAVFWWLTKPAGVLNAELEKTKGILKSVSSEAEAVVNKITKGQERVADIVKEAQEAGKSVSLEDVAGEQEKILENADRLVKLIEEYGEGLGDVRFTVGNTGQIETISVALAEGSSQIEIYNANLHTLSLTQAELVRRSADLQQVVAAVQGQMERKTFDIAVKQATALTDETAKLRAELNSLTKDTDVGSGNIAKPYDTQIEKAARAIQIQIELNSKVRELATSLRLVGKSEEEIKATIEKANAEFVKQHGVVRRLGDLLKSALTLTWVDSRKEMDLMTKAAGEFAIKAVPEFEKVKPEILINRWARSMYEFRDSITETLEELEKLKKDAGGVLDDLFEFDKEEATRYFEFIEYEYTRSIEELEALSDARVKAFARSADKSKSIAVLEAQEAIRLEASKVKAAEETHLKKLQILQDYVNKNRLIAQEAGKDTFDIDKEEYESKKQFAHDRLSIIKAALDAERDAHQKLADEVKRLEDEKKSAVKKLADIREALANKGLTKEQVYANESAKLADLVAKARIAALGGNFKQAVELADKASDLASDLAGKTEKAERKKNAELEDQVDSLENIYSIAYKGMEDSALGGQKAIADSTSALEAQFKSLIDVLKELETVMTEVTGRKAVKEGFKAEGDQLQKNISLAEAYSTAMKEMDSTISATKMVPLELEGGFKTVTPETTVYGTNLELLNEYEAKLKELEKIKQEAARTGVVSEEQRTAVVKIIGDLGNMGSKIREVTGIDPLEGVDLRASYEKIKSNFGQVIGYTTGAITGQINTITANANRMFDAFLEKSPALREAQKQASLDSLGLGEDVQKAAASYKDLNKDIEQAKGLKKQADLGAELAEKSTLAMSAGDQLKKVLEGISGLDLGLESLLEADPQTIKQTGQTVLGLRAELEKLVEVLPKLVARGLLDSGEASKINSLLTVMGDGWQQYIDNVGEGADVNEKAADSLRTKIVDAVEFARVKIADLTSTSEGLKRTGLDIGLEGLSKFGTQALFIKETLDDIKTRTDLGELGLGIGEVQSSLNSVLTEFKKMKAEMEKPIEVTVNTTHKKAAGGVVALASQQGGHISKFVEGGVAKVQKFINGSHVFRKPGYSVVPGVGSGDKIPALLEPGEFIIRKSSVRKFGVDFLNMVNQGVLRMSSLGGLMTTPDRLTNIISSVIPTPQYQTVMGYAGGGVVTAATGSKDVVDINLNIGGSKTKLSGERQEVRKLVNSLRYLDRG